MRHRCSNSFPEKECITLRANPVVVVVFRHNSRIPFSQKFKIPNCRLIRPFPVYVFAVINLRSCQFKCSFVFLLWTSSLFSLCLSLSIRQTVFHRPCWCAIGSASQSEPKVSWSLLSRAQMGRTEPDFRGGRQIVQWQQAIMSPLGWVSGAKRLALGRDFLQRPRHEKR